MAQDFEIDSREFQQAAQKLIGLMRKTIPEFLKYQARLFVRYCMRATPPFGKHSITENYSTQRKIGEGAVRRDIAKVFLPVEHMKLAQLPDDDNLGNSVRKYIQAGNMNAIRDILNKLGLSQIPLLGTPDASIHKSARGSNGRVSKGNRHLVMSAASVKKYTREIVKNVGKFKSGWKKAAYGLGEKVPAWVDRHNEPGVFDDDLNHPTEPSVTIGNSSAFASRTEADIMSFAYKTVIASMKRETAAKLQHEFNKVNAR